MKLTYRGINYNVPSSGIQVTEGPVGGKFRGRDWHYQIPLASELKEVAAKLVNCTLNYRGVSYVAQVAQETAPAMVTAPESSSLSTIASVIPHLAMRHRLLQEVANAHRVNIVKSAEHRLEVARARGDLNLVRLIEAELQQIA